MRRSLEAIDAVIGLGANLGEPRATLGAALEALAGLGTLQGVSRLYRTAPVGGPPQPDFLNAAARLTYAGEPEALLGDLLGIERRFGRTRRVRWGPRVLDLDVLWIAGKVVHTGALEVPHPRLVERAFALDPLLDVAPEAADPRTGRPYRLARAQLADAGVTVVASADWGSEAGQAASRSA